MPILASVNGGQQQFGYELDGSDVTVWAINGGKKAWRVEIDLPTGTQTFVIPAKQMKKKNLPGVGAESKSVIGTTIDKDTGVGTKGTVVLWEVLAVRTGPA